MDEIVEIKVGYAYMPSPKEGVRNRRRWCYYVNDNGSPFVYDDLAAATSMAISLFRGYHKTGRKVRITNY